MLTVNGLYIIIVASAVAAIEFEQNPFLVHVLFRHGDRTPVSSVIYPNDPFKNETFEPYGRGQLTNEGKQRAYNLGLFLRHRYRDLIGDSYHNGLIYARSTDSDRTKMSLQLVLAGLFPPNYQQIWDRDVNCWQPIPYDYLPATQDHLLFGLNCSNSWKYYGEYVRNNSQELVEPYGDLFEDLSEHTGWKIDDLRYVYYLYFTFKSQEEWGLEIPAWARTVYPQVLEDLTRKHYTNMAATDELKTILSGPLLQKIVEDTLGTINGTVIPSGRKLFLYSGHEVNVGTFLTSLGLALPEIPSYASCILVEVHRIRGTFGIKMYYKSGFEKEPILLKLPQCRRFCSLKKFVSLVQKYYPDKDTCNN